MTVESNDSKVDYERLANEQSLRYAADVAFLYEQERLRRREAESARQRLEAVIEGMTDGMAATDEGYRVAQFNSAFIRLFGLRGRLVGEDLFALIEAPEMRESVVQGLFVDGSMSFELELPESGGFGAKAVRVLASAMRDNGRVFVFHNITAERRAENMHKEFLALLSHELRTPLNGLGGFIQILEERPEVCESEDASECVAMIKDSTRRLTRAFEELLGYARIQAEESSSMAESVNLSVAANEIAGALRAEAANKDIDVRVETRAAGESVVEGNAAMLRSMLHHLLHNCIAHGRHGGFAEIRLMDAGDEVEIEVEDNGGGIEPEEIGKVFRGFYQAREYTRRKTEGLGLGLALVDRVIKLHGGAVDISSVPNGGTVVNVRLPKRRQHETT